MYDSLLLREELLCEIVRLLFYRGIDRFLENFQVRESTLHQEVFQRVGTAIKHVLGRKQNKGLNLSLTFVES